MAPPKSKKTKNKDYVCVPCDRWFRLGGIEKHNAERHVTYRALCKKCWNKIPTRADLLRHREEGHSGKVPNVYYRLKGLPIPRRGRAEEQEEDTRADSEDQRVDQAHRSGSENDNDDMSGDVYRPAEDDQDSGAEEDIDDGAEEDDGGLGVEDSEDEY